MIVVVELRRIARMTLGRAKIKARLAGVGVNGIQVGVGIAFKDTPLARSARFGLRGFPIRYAAAGHGAFGFLEQRFAIGIFGHRRVVHPLFFARGGIERKHAVKRRAVVQHAIGLDGRDFHIRAAGRRANFREIT